MLDHKHPFQNVELTIALDALVSHTRYVLLLATIARDALVCRLTTQSAVLDETELQKVLCLVDGEERMTRCMSFPRLRRGHAGVAPVEIYTPPRVRSHRPQ